MTRTKSQDIRNNLKVPSTKGTTVEPTSRPTVVSAGTLTEGLWGSGRCCHAPDDDVKSGTDFDLRSIVNILCDRISDLEKSVRKQSAQIADLTRHGLRVDAGVQTDIENRDLSRATYAEVVRSILLIQNDTTSASERSVGAQNISVEPSDSKYTGKKFRKLKWKEKEKRDVIFHMSSTTQKPRLPPPDPHLPLPAAPPPPRPPPPPPSPQLMQFCDPCYVDAQTSGFVGLEINAFPGLCVHYFCVPCCVC